MKITMTYKEICKVTFNNAIKTLRHGCYTDWARVADAAIDLLYFVANIVFVVIYLLTFPISSGIVFWLHKKNQKTVNLTKQELIKKKFPGLKVKE